LFLKHLRRAGAISATDQPRDQDPALLTAFREWMRQQRGACDLTICRYSLSIRDLLKRFGEDPGRFDAKGLRRVCPGKSQHRGCAEAKNVQRRFACFFVFLIAEGKCSADPECSHSSPGALATFFHCAVPAAGRGGTDHILSCESQIPGWHTRSVRFSFSWHVWDFGLGDILQLRLRRYRLGRRHDPRIGKRTS